MSSKIEVVKALESADWSDVSIGNKALIQAAIELLAAPVVERCTSCDDSGDLIDFTGEWRGYCACPYGEALKKNPAAPLELAELQATIVQLTAENERLRTVTKFDEAVACVFDFAKMAAANTGCREWDEQLEIFADDVIDFSPEYKRQWLDIVKTCIERDAYKAELERLKGGQGEPVAWLTMCKASGLVEQAEPNEKASNPEYWSEAFPVFASQPAPVSVVDEHQAFANWTHEVIEFEHADITRKIQRRDLMDVKDEKSAWEGWQARARLDKVKELNQ